MFVVTLSLLLRSEVLGLRAYEYSVLKDNAILLSKVSLQIYTFNSSVQEM